MQRAERTGNTYPTEAKLAHDTSATAGLRTSVLNGSGAGIPPKSVELELGLIADLRREGLVASYVEVGSAGDFVGGYAFAGFDIAKNSYFWHDSLSLMSA